MENPLPPLLSVGLERGLRVRLSKPRGRSGRADILRSKRQAPDTLTGSSENRVRNCTLNHGCGRLAKAAWRLAWCGFNEGDFHLLWRFVDSNHAVLIEVALLDRVVLHCDLAEHTSRLAKVDARFRLGQRLIRMNQRTGVHHRHNAVHRHVVRTANSDLYDHCRNGIIAFHYGNAAGPSLWQGRSPPGFLAYCLQNHLHALAHGHPGRQTRQLVLVGSIRVQHRKAVIDGIFSGGNRTLIDKGLERYGVEVMDTARQYPTLMPVSCI